MISIIQVSRCRRSTPFGIFLAPQSFQEYDETKGLAGRRSSHADAIPRGPPSGGIQGRHALDPQCTSHLPRLEYGLVA